MGDIVTLGQESAKFKKETSGASAPKAEGNASEDVLYSSPGASARGADSPSNVQQSARSRGRTSEKRRNGTIQSGRNRINALSLHRNTTWNLNANDSM